MARGPLVILSGPSGSGKSTVIQRLLADPPGPLRLSVSATTRPPRAGETDGVAYHFWTHERFEQQLAAGAFLEHACVHGNYYGTLRAEVEPYLRDGWGVILDIDVQGADQVRQKCPDHVSVFLLAPSPEEYERRLRLRGTEDETSIQRRLAAARAELARAAGYQYQITNDHLAKATAELRAIVAREFERRRNAR
ncbi:MAG TPA: guanylate kinase [Gemmataceae bacterium]